MARITSRQAQEMMDAYAKVYEPKEEPVVETPVNETPVEDIQEGPLDSIPMTGSRATRFRNKQGKEDLNTKTLKTNSNTSTNNKTPVKTQNNQTTEKPASGGSSGNSGGLTTLSGKPSRLSTYAQQKVASMRKDMKDAGVKPNEGPSTVSSVNSTGTAKKVDNQSSGGSTRKGGGSVKVDGKALMSKLKADSGDRVQSSGNTPSPKQPTQEPGVKTSQTVVKDGNRTTTTTKRSADDSTPEGAAAVAKEKAAFQARREARRSGNTGSGGQPSSTQGGGQPTGGQASQTRPVPGRGQGNRSVAGNQNRRGGNPGVNPAAAIKGGLSRLGSLAGKAVAGARNVASNVKQGAQAVAGGIKQGAQAVAGALANKGPIQGRASGPQRRAQQAQNRTGRPVPAANAAPAAKPVATRPVQGQQPAAKPVVTQQQPAKKMGSIERQNRARFGNDKVDALKSKNAEFQAAKKSGNLAQYRKANPKMSGADRAKAMAKARIAAKNAPAPTPATKPVAATPINSSYDFFDDTVQFLVSEGHAKDVSEAMSIMSESEFIDAFNQELNG